MNIITHHFGCTRLILASFIVLFSSCVIEISTSGNPATPPVTTPAIKVDFPVSTTTRIITIDNLLNRDVYLVKANVSGVAVSGINTGSASVMNSPSVRSITSVADANSNLEQSAVSGVYNGVSRLDYLPAREFNENPPPFHSISGASRSVLAVTSIPYIIGDTKTFWVQKSDMSWIPIDATVRAVGTHSYVWVAAANYNSTSTLPNDDKLTTQQAISMADKFDLIYPLETNVLGYEYGGGPSASPVGGIDGDTRVSILIYDIDFDAFGTQNSGTFGFFWSKDLYTQQELIANNSSYMTNVAEIFYLDSNFTDKFSDEMYSTLVHEFQHMINFNKKNIQKRIQSANWYNEMLAQVAEDMLASKIGIDINASPSQARIPLFNANYASSGVTVWNSNLISYSNVYAFGAYLVRNYGGAALVNAMLDNSYTDKDSISAALKSLYPATFPAGLNAFDIAFRRYGEALVYSGLSVTGGANSLDKTVTTAINTTSYTFPAIDIWNQPNEEAGSALPAGYKGPTVWQLSSKNTMSPYSVILQSADEWQNVTGSLSLQVNKPVDSDVELFLMVR